MHDVDHRHGHHHEHGHEHGHEHDAEQLSVLDKLKKMAEHWIGHNEEHARSYRLWADRAREAGREEPGAILDEIASEMAAQNEKIRRIIELLEK